jgi:hypothetical protein
MKLTQNLFAFFMIIMESIFLMNARNENNDQRNWILQDNQWIEISFLAAISFLFIWNIFIAMMFNSLV